MQAASAHLGPCPGAGIHTPSLPQAHQHCQRQSGKMEKSAIGAFSCLFFSRSRCVFPACPGRGTQHKHELRLVLVRLCAETHGPLFLLNSGLAALRPLMEQHDGTGRMVSASSSSRMLLSCLPCLFFTAGLVLGLGGCLAATLALVIFASASRRLPPATRHAARRPPPRLPSPAPLVPSAVSLLLPSEIARALEIARGVPRRSPSNAGARFARGPKAASRSALFSWLFGYVIGARLRVLLRLRLAGAGHNGTDERASRGGGSGWHRSGRCRLTSCGARHCAYSIYSVYVWKSPVEVSPTRLKMVQDSLIQCSESVLRDALIYMF